MNQQLENQAGDIQNTPPVESTKNKQQLPPLFDKKKLIPLFIFAVIAVGIIAAVYAAKETILKEPTPTPTQTIFPTPTTIQNQTSNWKTYTDPNKLFSFQYPNEPNFQANYYKNDSFITGAEILYNAKSGTKLKNNIAHFYVLISIVKNNENITLLQRKQTLLSMPKSTTPYATNIKDVKDYNNGEISGVSYILRGHRDSFEIEYVTSDKFLHFSSNSEGTAPEGEARELLDQILSTFKFTDQNDTVVCTQDAKLCPNGSYVSRTGPKCEFTPCP